MVGVNGAREAWPPSVLPILDDLVMLWPGIEAGERLASLSGRQAVGWSFPAKAFTASSESRIG
jgi:hypothetical protein